MTQTAPGPDASGRLRYLNETAAMLWPDAGRLEVAGRRGGDVDYWLVPNAAKPRLLVPAGSRAAAATAVRHYGERLSRAARLRSAALAAGLRTGVVQRVLADPVQLADPVDFPTGSITEYLSSQLGEQVLVSMHLSPPRANRKPVLQLLTPAGRVVAFAKIGVSPLTAALVRAETTALRRLATASAGVVRAPRVLHAGSWNDLEILVVAALPVWRRREQASGRLTAAIREIAGLCPARTEPLSTSGYAADLRGRLDGCPATPERERLRELLSTIEHRHGDQPLTFGGWHGDLTPWNCAAVGGRMLVWDWERFAGPVPLGFDVLHHRLQTDTVQRGVGMRQAAAGCIADVRPLADVFELTAGQARSTALLYLVEIGTRYLADDQRAAGAPAGRVEDWLLPALAAGLERR